MKNMRTISARGFWFMLIAVVGYGIYYNVSIMILDSEYEVKNESGVPINASVYHRWNKYRKAHDIIVAFNDTNLRLKRPYLAIGPRATDIGIPFKDFYHIGSHLLIQLHCDADISAGPLTDKCKYDEMVYDYHLTDSPIYFNTFMQYKDYGGYIFIRKKNYL